MSIFPTDLAGGLPVRDEDRNPVEQPTVENAYVPSASFGVTCALNYLPSTCDARIEPRQLNSIVSELLCLAASFNPDGTWNCQSLCNLSASFQVWVEANKLTAEKIAQAIAADPEQAIVIAGLLISGAEGNLISNNGGIFLSATDVADGICASNDARATLAGCLLSSGDSNILTTVSDGINLTASGVVSSICGNIAAKVALSNCLISEDPDNSLTVGEDGGLFTTGGSGGATIIPPLRNHIINGDFAIAQRQNSSFLTFGRVYHGPDRWAFYSADGPNDSCNMQVGPTFPGNYLIDLLKNYRMTSLPRSSAIINLPPNATGVRLSQIIESFPFLASDKITVTFFVINNSGENYPLDVNLRMRSVNDGSIYVEMGTQTANIAPVSDSFTKFQFVFDSADYPELFEVYEPAAGLELEFAFPDNTAGSFFLTAVSVVTGDASTEPVDDPGGFIHPSIEFNRCLRYYRGIKELTGVKNGGTAFGTAWVHVSDQFPVPLRNEGQLLRGMQSSPSITINYIDQTTGDMTPIIGFLDIFVLQRTSWDADGFVGRARIDPEASNIIMTAPIGMAFTFAPGTGSGTPGFVGIDAEIY